MAKPNPNSGAPNATTLFRLLNFELFISPFNATTGKVKLIAKLGTAAALAGVGFITYENLTYKKPIMDPNAKPVVVNVDGDGESQPRRTRSLRSV